MSHMWVPVYEFPGYEISPLGQIRSYLSRNGKGEFLKTPRLLKGGLDYLGYKVVTLQGNGGRCSKRVHRLVLESFCGPPPPGKQCAAHKNGDPSDARLENLVWASHKENSGHMRLHGTLRMGETSPSSKLKTRQVIEIRRRFESGEKQIQIAKKLGIKPQLVNKIVNRSRWKHL